MCLSVSVVCGVWFLFSRGREVVVSVDIGIDLVVVVALCRGVLVVDGSGRQ